MLEIVEVLILPIRCIGHDGKVAQMLLFQIYIVFGLITLGIIKRLEQEGFHL